MRVTSLLKGTNSLRESSLLGCIVSETILLYVKHFLLKRNLYINIEENYCTIFFHPEYYVLLLYIFGTFLWVRKDISHYMRKETKIYKSQEMLTAQK